MIGSLGETVQRVLSTNAEVEIEIAARLKDDSP